MDGWLAGITGVTISTISLYLRFSKAPLIRRAVTVLLIAAVGTYSAIIGPDGIRQAVGAFHRAFRAAETIDPHRRIVHVGDRSLVLPAPPGFVMVGAELPEFLKNVEAKMLDNARRVVTLVSEEDHAKLVKGEEVLSGRLLAVDVSRRFEQVQLGIDDFAKVREASRKLEDKLRAAVSPELFATLENDAGRPIGERERAALANGVHLPPHRDTERIFAVSILKKEDGAISTMTSSVVLVGDTMIFLRATGGEKDLAWTRQITDKWADAILAANAR